MATGRDQQLTKQAGEYLVVAELCRRGFVATTFTGNVPEFDILATDKGLSTIPIQVKTIKKGDWQPKLKDFVEISQSGDIQTVKGKTKLANPDLIYIFVRLRGQNQDEFYVCLQKDVQDIMYKKYNKYLKKWGGRRPKNPKSTHCKVTLKDLEDYDYKDAWEIITK